MGKVDGKRSRRYGKVKGVVDKLEKGDGGMQKGVGVRVEVDRALSEGGACPWVWRRRSRWNCQTICFPV